MHLEDGTLVCSGTLSGMRGAGDEAARGRDRARRRRAERRRRRRVRRRAARRAARASAACRGWASSASAARWPASRTRRGRALRATFDDDELLAMNSNQRFACLAALEAWADAGLARPTRTTSASTGTPARSSAPASAAWTRSREKVVPLTDAGKVRRLGSTRGRAGRWRAASRRASRACSALGNQVTTNSSACSTGTRGDRRWARCASATGSPSACCAAAPRARATTSGPASTRCACSARDSNDAPERASRPMSASAGGFVPGSGAGVLLLESLDSARARGARIYAEVLGRRRQLRRPPRRRQHDRAEPDGRAALHPQPRSPTPAIAARRGRRDQRSPDGDRRRPARGARLGGRRSSARPRRFPSITATKSMIGHALGAAGAIESVASVLMLAGRLRARRRSTARTCTPRSRRTRRRSRTRCVRCPSCGCSPRPASASATSTRAWCSASGTTADPREGEKQR